MGVTHPVNIPGRQIAGMINNFGKKELRKLRNTIDESLEESSENESSSTSAWDTTSAAETASRSSYIAVPPAGPPPPTPDRAKCYHGEEAVILMRRFRQCPHWKNTNKRREFFQWLEHQPDWKDAKHHRKKLNDEICNLTDEQRRMQTTRPHLCHGGARGSGMKKDCGFYRTREDEIRWHDLRDQQRRLPLHSQVATIFQVKVSEGSTRKMRHFPGTKQIRLEKLTRDFITRTITARCKSYDKAKPREAIQIGKDLKCSVCSSYSLPDAPRRSAPPREAMTVNSP